MYRKALFVALLGALSCFFLEGCESRKEWQYHDPKLQYQKEDYDLLTKAPTKPQPRIHKKKKSFYKAPPIPLAFKKDVTITVTQAVPLKELLLTLAQQISVDVIIDPKISGGTTLHATKRPMIHVVDEICRSHGLRYRVSNNILRIERDTAYTQNYNLQFLVMARANRNRLSIATDVFTTVEGGARPDEDNGSNTYLTAETKTDFWDELSENLSIILNDFGNGQDGDSDTVPAGKYSIHKQAGIISIHANQNKHQQLQRYLDVLQQSIERQVLIEAKIVEVNLKDEFKSGINWNVLKGDFVLQMPFGDLAVPGHLNEALAPAKNVFTLGGNSKKITGLLSLLNHFGTVRTLSNPRLTVMNNNPAILKVARNKVYFKLNYTRDYNYFEKRENTYYSSDVKTVPIGLMMYVHPTIREDGKIIMTLRPTISQIAQEIADPAVGIASKQALQSLVPEVQVRELDTLLAMNSGEIVVVGGLMEERSANQKDGVPEAEDVPLLGGLFKGKSNERTVTELVVFLRATIIENDLHPHYQETSVMEADKSAYKAFTSDPRPLNF